MRTLREALPARQSDRYSNRESIAPGQQLRQQADPPSQQAVSQRHSYAGQSESQSSYWHLPNTSTPQGGWDLNKLDQAYQRERVAAWVEESWNSSYAPDTASQPQTRLASTQDGWQESVNAFSGPPNSYRGIGQYEAPPQRDGGNSGQPPNENVTLLPRPGYDATVGRERERSSRWEGDVLARMAAPRTEFWQQADWPWQQAGSQGYSHAGPSTSQFSSLHSPPSPSEWWGRMLETSQDGRDLNKPAPSYAPYTASQPQTRLASTQGGWQESVNPFSGPPNPYRGIGQYESSPQRDGGNRGQLPNENFTVLQSTGYDATIGRERKRSSQWEGDVLARMAAPRTEQAIADRQTDRENIAGRQQFWQQAGRPWQQAGSQGYSHAGQSTSQGGRNLNKPAPSHAPHTASQPQAPVAVDNYPSPQAATESVSGAQRLANNPNAWLWDNDLLKYTQVIARELQNQRGAEQLHFVDPRQVRLLAEGNTEQRKAVLRRLTGPGTPPILFLPVNNNNNNQHWSLLVVNQGTKEALHYDSKTRPLQACRPTPSSQFQVAHRVAQALGVRTPMEMPTAKQRDKHSCGDYVLEGIKVLAQRMVSGDFIQNAGRDLSGIKPNRKHIVKVLTQVELLDAATRAASQRRSHEGTSAQGGRE